MFLPNLFTNFTLKIGNQNYLIINNSNGLWQMIFEKMFLDFKVNC